MGGLAFGDDFSVPVGDGATWGGDSHQGRSQMRGDLENCPLRPKKSPYSKIRANFGVLSIK